jgi:copper chaperone CopZ
MKKTLLIALFFGATNLFAQQQQDSILVREIPTIKNNVFQQRQEIDALTKKLKSQEYVVGKQNQSIEILQNKNKSLNSSIDSLNQLIQTNSQNIVTNSKELGSKIQETGRKADTKISELDSSVEKNRLYWIIATLVTLLLGGLVYWLLGKRIKSSKTDVETQIRNTKASLEEESVKLDSKLMEVLDTQLKLKDLSQSGKPESEEKDHSLVLKVADEVTRILMNLEVMDKNIKGYKHLKKYSESILDNLKAYGYEIPQLIGQNYKTGMNMVATMEFDDNIVEGKEIIKRIIKPQINYNGKMIQAAKVIVAYNE